MIFPDINCLYIMSKFCMRGIYFQKSVIIWFVEKNTKLRKLLHTTVPHCVISSAINMLLNNLLLVG